MSITSTIKKTTSFDIDSNIKNLKENSIPIIKETLVIIPCYNEEKNIEKAIKKLTSKIKIDFLIIDDCSTDKSLDIIKKNHWNYIHNKKNKGLTESFCVGVNYAIKNGYKYVVQYDGDGQHNPDDIMKLLYYAQKGYDIVSTSRYLSNDYKIETLKKTAHKLLRTLLLIKMHQKMTDPTCGLRLYNWLIMDEFMDNSKLEVEPSSIAYLVRKKKMKFKEVPTIVFEREHGESSFANSKFAFRYMQHQLFRIMFLFLNKSKKGRNYE